MRGETAEGDASLLETELSVLPQTKPRENRNLPTRLELSHTVAFSFLDQLTALVIFLEEQELLSESFQLEPGEETELEELSGDKLWVWLESHGHQDVLRRLAYRQVTAALVSDVCQFAFEALITAAKSKMTVAFSLLRKPFKENLLLLEWLLCEPEAFLDRFEGDVPSSYALSSIPQEYRKRLIKDALQRIDMPVLEADFLFDVRYSKKCDYGLERLWQKATHLVTTFRGLETEPGNLNFVFSSQTDIDDQLDMFYLVVPPLLLYSLLVADGVVGRLVPWNKERREVQLALRSLAYARHVEQVASPSEGSLQSMEELLEEVQRLLDPKCDQCGPVPLTGNNIDRLWSSAQVECAACGKTIDCWTALFSVETDRIAFSADRANGGTEPFPILGGQSEESGSS